MLDQDKYIDRPERASRVSGIIALISTVLFVVGIAMYVGSPSCKFAHRIPVMGCR